MYTSDTGEKFCFEGNDDQYLSISLCTHGSEEMGFVTEAIAHWLLSAFLDRKPVQNYPIMTIFSCDLGIGKAGVEERSDHTACPADSTTINT